MANCDSPTNLIWLINNTEAGGALKDAQAKIGKGESSAKGDQPPPPPPPTSTAGPTSFADFKLDVSNV